jgi:hypothetical protein
MLAHARGVRSATPAPVPARARLRTPADALQALVQRPLWQLSALSGAAALFVAAIFLGVMVETSANAAPGDWNYGFKLWVEDVRLTLASGRQEDELKLELVAERAEEIDRLATKGRLDLINSATNRYVDTLVRATHPVTSAANGDAPPPPPELVTKTEAVVTQAKVTLQTAQAKVEAKTSPPPQPPTQAPATVPSVEPTRPPTALVPDVQQRLQSALSATSQVQSATSQVAQEIQQAQTSTPSPTAPRVTATPTATATAEATGSATPAVSPTPTPSATPQATPTAPPTAPVSPTPSPTVPLPSVILPTPITPGPITPTPSATSGIAARPPVPALVPTATPTPTPTPARTPPPMPTPTPTPAVRLLVLDLVPGVNHFAWFGQTLPVDQALADLAGKYEWVEWTPPGGFTLYYAPGQPGSRPFLLTFGSQVKISMKQPATVPHGSYWNPDLARPLP